MASEVVLHFEAELKHHKIHKAKVEAMDKIFAINEPREELKSMFKQKIVAFQDLFTTVEQLRKEIANNAVELEDLTEKRARSQRELKQWFNENHLAASKLLEVLGSFGGLDEQSQSVSPAPVKANEADPMEGGSSQIVKSEQFPSPFTEGYEAKPPSIFEQSGLEDTEHNMTVMREAIVGSARFTQYLERCHDLSARKICATMYDGKLTELKPGFIKLEEELKQLQEKINQHDDAYQAAKEQWSIEWAKLWRPGAILKSEITTLNPALGDLLTVRARNNDLRIQLKNLTDKSEKLAPLVIAGYHIRRRKFEWQKDEQIEEILNMGHKAAHYGMAAADASMFGDALPESLTRLTSEEDKKKFAESYGAAPEIVLGNLRCEKLADLMDWRASVKEFTARPYVGVSFQNTKCYTQWQKFDAFCKFSSSYIGGPDKLASRFETEPFLIQTYQVMKDDHERYLQAHIENKGKKK